MNKSNSRPSWREVCRNAARFQATEEARAAWDVPADQPIPFNFRWEHVQEVTRIALWLAHETGADLEVVEAAAWLHDILKEESSHGVAGAEAARSILADTDFPPDKIDAVADAIRVHTGLYRADGAPSMQPLETALLWDADKLSKLGIHAIAFSLSQPRAQGKTLSERRLDAERFTLTVLNRTVASMNTAPARQLAERRHAAMLATLESWALEEREPDPPAV